MTNAIAGQLPNQALDALLAAYAAGSLSAPLHVLVASHLALKPRSRSFVRSLEAAGASALAAMVPVPVSNRDAMLDSIFAETDEPAEQPAPAAPEAGDPVLPTPLVHYLGRSLEELSWRAILPGVQDCKIERNERGYAVLYRIRPGGQMPSHTHEGSEYTLVLKGGYSDSYGHYRRGDISIADQDVDHRPVADPDEECICFLVSDGPVRLTGPVGRVLQRLTGKH